jgi:uncharacterized protein (UPF0147 family)
MQCEETREHFTDYLGDSLPENIRSAVQQHLITCESCRDEAEALKSIWSKLSAIPSERPDSDAMRARFEVMLEAYRQGMDHAPRSQWWTSANAWLGKWWPQQPVLQFGLTVALLAVGVMLGHQSRPAEIPPLAPAPASNVELSQLRDELHDMRQIVTLSLLQQQSASERLKGVGWSNQLDRPDSEVLNALMDTLMHDQNVNVRLAAVDALKKFGQDQSVKTGVLQALAKQDAPMVQVALIDYMVETQQRDSVGTLRQIAQNTSVNESVRQRAEWGLEHLK